MSDRPTVAVWRWNGALYAKVGQIGDYSTLTFSPTFRDSGDWSMKVPFDKGALIQPDRLVTIDWRGIRTTWTVKNPHYFQQPSADGSDPGSVQLEVTGGGALGLLARCLCWPDANKAIEIQPIFRLRDPAPYIGPAETILRQLIADNFRDRYGAPLVTQTNQARGSTVRVRPKMSDNLFEITQRFAKLGGIGVDIGLVNTDATHAKLTLQFWEPDDVSKRVRLSTNLKTIGGWDQNDTEPSATKAFVGTGDTKAVRTTLAADLSSSATALTVASSSDFPDPDASTPSFRVTIGGESLSVIGVSGKTWTVRRGYGSTTPASHDSGDRVSLARTFTVVTTSASTTAATFWGGHREVFVDGPSTKDTAEIIDSGKASLSDGAETRALTVVTTEPRGMQAFTHYTVGDIATAEVATGATAVANISAISVTVDADSGISVAPVFGEPSNVNSTLRIAKLIQNLTRRVRGIEGS